MHTAKLKISWRVTESLGEHGVGKDLFCFILF